MDYCKNSHMVQKALDQECDHLQFSHQSADQKIQLLDADCRLHPEY